MASALFCGIFFLADFPGQAELFKDAWYRHNVVYSLHAPMRFIILMLQLGILYGAYFVVHEWAVAFYKQRFKENKY